MTVSNTLCDFYVILMTKNLLKQAEFYQEVIGLEIIFQHQEAIALGKHSKIFILLKLDLDGDSHHKSEQKGPSILTFKMSGVIEHWASRVKAAGCTVRDHLILSEHRVSYLFIEDRDENEICIEILDIDNK